MNEETLQNLAKEVANRLIDQSLTMATAESCTRSWVSKIVTDIDGGSQWFECTPTR